MAGRDMSIMDRRIAESKITEGKKKEYIWLGERLFGWKYLPAVGAWIDKEGRTASEGVALRWMRSPSGMFEVIDTMNSQGFFLNYEQYQSLEKPGHWRVEHRAAFLKTFHRLRGMAYSFSFVDVVLDAAYRILKDDDGEAA